ncbi:MAG: GNAT family N-acetyltransferase [Burkholderiales bacterium]|nr:GNAT family N-acetyltransferase [Burkholderiales bacterium]
MSPGPEGALAAPLLERAAALAGLVFDAPVRAALGLVDGAELLRQLEPDEGLVEVEWLGEWALQREAGDAPPRLLREHVLAIAQRNDWAPAADADADAGASVAAAAGVRQRRERLRQALQAHAAVLRAEGFDAAAAQRELQRREQDLAAGRAAIARLRLERTAVPPARLVDVGPVRSSAMRGLFEAVFGHPMTAAHWAWKYGDGRGRAVGLEHEGELVAHYGGISRELRLFGRPAWGCQVCDVMVAPKANRSLARRGPMQRIAATFLETQIGHGLPHAAGFGFPSDRHHGVADRLKLYTAVDRIVQLEWPAASGARARAVAGWRLEPLRLQAGALPPVQHRAVDALWQAMAADLGDVVLGVRDARWLGWRYLQRPGIDYELWLVKSRWWSRPLAVLALRRHADALELLDLVAPGRRFALALAAARARAAELGLPLLRCWITASQAHRLGAGRGELPRTRDPGIQVPCNLHTAALPPSALENRWFLLGGDADFT